jgi:hypothetical protein
MRGVLSIPAGMAGKLMPHALTVALQALPAAAVFSWAAGSALHLDPPKAHRQPRGIAQNRWEPCNEVYTKRLELVLGRNSGGNCYPGCLGRCSRSRNEVRFMEKMGIRTQDKLGNN